MGVGIRFEETMRGHLAPLTGAERRRMTLHARVESPSLAGLWLNTPMTLTGTMELEGMGSAMPTTGTIEVDLLGCRRIVYDLGWRDADGAPARFFGWKSLSVRHLRQSVTELTGQVIEQGTLAGHATLRFDLADLPKFIGSLRPHLTR